MMGDFTQSETTFEDTTNAEQVLKEVTQGQFNFESDARQEQLKRLEELEIIMNKGLEFLSGMFKMSTGQELFTSDNKMEVNKETGEVVIRFKLPI